MISPSTRRAACSGWWALTGSWSGDLRIDGERLHRTEYQITITDAAGEIAFAATGSEFVSETYRRFFSGTGEVTQPGRPTATKRPRSNSSIPVRKGYLDNTPKYGCDVLSTRAVLK